MSEVKLERLVQLKEKLKEDLDRDRIKVSEASKTYTEFCSKTPDPFIHNGLVDANANPFTKSTRSSPCIIL